MTQMNQSQDSGSGLRRHLRAHFREWCVALVLAVVLLFLAVKAPAFFKANQLLPMLTAAAPVLLVSCGVSLVIICRQIDISIGSQFAWCSIVLGLLVHAKWPVPLAAVTSILVGGLFGAFNGLLVAGLRLPSIVVTLATMVTWREALRWWREGEFVRDLPERFQWLGLGQGKGQAAILICATTFFLAMAFALKFLAGGRFIYAVGSDAEAARLAGMNRRR